MRLAAGIGQSQHSWGRTRAVYLGHEEAARGTLTGKFLRLHPLSPPILAVARPDSEIGEILRQTLRGRLCSTTAEIEEFLNAVRTDSRAFTGNPQCVAAYSMRQQAASLCSFLDAIVESASAGGDATRPRFSAHKAAMTAAQSPLAVETRECG